MIDMKTDIEEAVKFAELMVGPCKSKKERKKLIEWAKYVNKELENF